VQDCSHPLDAATPTYPGDPPVTVEPHATHDADGYRVTRLGLGSHAGTHVDAPAHTEPDGATLDALSVDRFAFDALLVDCRDVGAHGEISVERLVRAFDDAGVDAPGDADGDTDPVGETDAGPGGDTDVDAGPGGDTDDDAVDLLVCRTGWDAHWGTDRYHDHPHLAPAAAEWCADRGLSVGLDAASPDPFGDADLPAHHALLGSDRVLVENLTNLAGLPRRFRLLAFPLPVAVDGSPVRAVAVP
jgi:kynurenine formamidase